jgi:epoxide hydrolase-like protein
MSATTEQSGAAAIRPFSVDIPEEALQDLRRRVGATRLPSKELVSDRSQGVQLATIQELAHYWVTEYDWRRCEAKLNALPRFKTEIDGEDIHFIHVKSRHEDALALIMTAQQKQAPSQTQRPQPGRSDTPTPVRQRTPATPSCRPLTRRALPAPCCSRPERAAADDPARRARYVDLGASSATERWTVDQRRLGKASPPSLQGELTGAKSDQGLADFLPYLRTAPVPKMAVPSSLNARRVASRRHGTSQRDASPSTKAEPSDRLGSGQLRLLLALDGRPMRHP